MQVAGAPTSAGFVTAEVAVLLPALTLLTALCVSMVGAVVVHVRCLDAARTGARAVSRDEPVDAVLGRDQGPGAGGVGGDARSDCRAGWWRSR